MGLNTASAWFSPSSPAPRPFEQLKHSVLSVLLPISQAANAFKQPDIAGYSKCLSEFNSFREKVLPLFKCVGSIPCFKNHV
ncbi:MAG: hypothetical protein QM654_17155 [Dysgonamonadaceae bacterium]